MEITYNQKTYKADNKKELIRILREERLPYSTIAGLVGCSRSYVGHVLNHHFGIYGELDFPELRNKATFENKTDEQVSRELNIPLFRVIRARKKFDIRRHSIIRLHRRRRELVKFLFGNRYNPGKKFEQWLEKIIKSLTDRQEEIIREFYLEGTSESTHKKINSDSDRVYRSLIRKELKKVVSDFDKHDLIEKGVLKNGSHSQSN